MILTKLNAPADFVYLVLRPRLMNRLLKNINYPVMLIQGPAGFGKTSLATQWRECLISKNHTVAWLSLDAQDNDPVRCLNYIVAAISNAEKSIVANTTILFESQSSQAINHVITELVNQLESLDKKMYLILDDWHFITNKATHDILNFLIEFAPRQFHLIICSRTQPPLPIYSLYAKNQLCLIDSTDLRFNEVETSCFLSVGNKLNLKSEDIHTLWEKTEGWVASLQLISIIMQTQKDKNKFIDYFDAIENTHSINEYFVENVLNNLSSDTLDFLLQTSILDRLNNDLCNTVTQTTNSQIMLESLYEKGMFVRPLDHEHCWFQYHHLFAYFLQRRLQLQMPDKLQTLHLSAAQWFAVNNQVDESVEHAIAAKEIDYAISLVEKESMWLVEHSFMGVLLRLVDKLPEKDIETCYELQLAIAWAHCLTHHPKRAQKALNFVDLALQNIERSDESSIRVEAKVLQACIHMYADRLDKTEQVLPEHFDKQDNHNPWVIVVANNIRSYILIHNYQFDNALQLQHQVSQFHQQTRGPFSCIYGDCFAGIAHLEQCQLDMAEQYYNKAQKKAWDKSGKKSHASYLAASLLGQLYYERNQLDKAEALLNDSLSLGVEGGIANFYIAAYCFSIRLAIAKKDFSEAYALLIKGQQVAQELCITRLEYLLKAELVKLQLIRGDIQSAQKTMYQWNYSDQPLQVSSIAEQLFEIRATAEARLLYITGQYQKAIEILSSILQTTISKQRHYYEISTRILLAKVLNKAGHSVEAEDMLLPALIKGFEQNLIRMFIDEDIEVIKVIERLNKQCRQNDIEMATAEFSRWLLVLIETYKSQAQSTEASFLYTENSIQNSEIIVENLKEKEMRILEMLGNALSNKEIAKNLNISVDTVKWYLKSIYNVLGVSRRAQAVIEAKKLNIL